MGAFTREFGQSFGLLSALITRTFPAVLVQVGGYGPYKTPDLHILFQLTHSVSLSSTSIISILIIFVITLRTIIINSYNYYFYSAVNITHVLLTIWSFGLFITTLSGMNRLSLYLHHVFFFLNKSASSLLS